MTDTGPGKRYTDEERELGYELWAYVCGENAEEVAVMLGREGITVPGRTVRDWAVRYGWAERMATELDTLAPAIRARTARELVIGGLEAARTLRRSVRADLDPGDRPDKTAITAAVALLDRAGFSPLGRTAAPDVAAPDTGARALPDVALLSLEDIDARERDYLERLRRAAADRLRDQRR